jgi:hypothetical protein
MAIGSAVQRGALVYVYDERGRQLFAKAGTIGGYTGSTVTLKNGSITYTYDERGRQLFAK